MLLASSALATRIPAGDVSLDQRAAQGFSDRRKLLGQTLPALAQSQLRKPFEPATCLHLSASIHQNAPYLRQVRISDLRISSYLTDSEGNRVGVRDSWCPSGGPAKWE